MSEYIPILAYRMNNLEFYTHSGIQLLKHFILNFKWQRIVSILFILQIHCIVVQLL